MADPELRLDGIHHRYPAVSRPVLAGVSLALRPGELVALVGPNGAGKTTLLRIAAGTLVAERGSVELMGRSIESWTRREIAQRVAVLPQDPTLPTGFRVEEAVAMGRAPHASGRFTDSPADVEAVEQALVEAQADALVGRRVETLSGGERQRVQVARALAQAPQVLLLDEPTVHLDIGHQHDLLSTLAVIRNHRNLAVLAVLHDLDLVRRHVPRTVVLAGGRILADDATTAAISPARVEAAFGMRSVSVA